MEFKRVGVLLFVLGLCLSLFSAVAFGFVSGSTEALCIDHEPTYSIVSVDVTDLDVTFSNGCNEKGVNPLVTSGGLLAVAGLAVGLGGIIQDRPSD